MGLIFFPKPWWPLLCLRMVLKLAMIADIVKKGMTELCFFCNGIIPKRKSWIFRVIMKWNSEEFGWRVLEQVFNWVQCTERDVWESCLISAIVHCVPVTAFQPQHQSRVVVLWLINCISSVTSFHNRVQCRQVSSGQPPVCVSPRQASDSTSCRKLGLKSR